MPRIYRHLSNPRDRNRNFVPRLTNYARRIIHIHERFPLRIGQPGIRAGHLSRDRQRHAEDVASLAFRIDVDHGSTQPVVAAADQ